MWRWCDFERRLPLQLLVAQAAVAVQVARGAAHVLPGNSPLRYCFRVKDCRFLSGTEAVRFLRKRRAEQALRSVKLDCGAKPGDSERSGPADYRRLLLPHPRLARRAKFDQQLVLVERAEM